MEKIAIEEVLKPLDFHEVIESHIIPFDIWLKTGHLEGMPGEIYYVAEPASRDVERWEHFIDLTKITKEIPVEELKKNLSIPTAGICYAQCPMIYWSFKGKTIAEKSLPVLVYDKTAISCRYESGGRHGIERVDEFHRIEPVYIGTKEQLLLRELYGLDLHFYNTGNISSATLVYGLDLHFYNTGNISSATLGVIIMGVSTSTKSLPVPGFKLSTYNAIVLVLKSFPK
jgi:seryl-tRNA synthetase